MIKIIAKRLQIKSQKASKIVKQEKVVPKMMLEKSKSQGSCQTLPGLLLTSFLELFLIDVHCFRALDLIDFTDSNVLF